MRSAMQKITLCLLCLVLSIVLAACGGEGDGGGTTLPEGTYTMTFVTNGGTVIPTITAEAGKTVTPPADPEKEGYTFEGWYEDASFSGVAVGIPEVMPDRNVTYYARFEEINENLNATLTLNVGRGGTLAKSSFELPVGTKVADFLKDQTPTPIGDASFIGWYDGANPVSAGKTLPRKGLSLEAKYTVGYSVSIFSWSGNKADYTPGVNEPTYPHAPDKTLTFEGILGEDILQKDIQSALIGQVDSALELDRIGSTKLTLGTSAASNTVAAYYKWKQATVIFMGGYAEENEILGETRNLVTWLGETVSLPENGYTLTSGRFAGWGATAEASLLYPVGSEFKAENGTNVFYANWNLSIIDSAGGYDLLYLLREQPNTVLLERAGLPVKTGSYNPEDRSFAFLGDGRDGALIGKISAEGDSFVYYSEARNASFTCNAWMGERNTSVLKLDGYDGAVYTEDGKSYVGTYGYDTASGCYRFTGDSLTFVFFLTGTEFCMRHEPTANSEYMCMTTDGRVTEYPMLYTDGFGKAWYMADAASEELSVTYTVLSEADGKSILVFEKGKLPFDECQVQVAALEDGSRISVYELPHTRSMTVSYPVEGGIMTLTTNGYDSASYSITRTGLPTENGSVSYYVLGEYLGYYYLAYTNGMDPATGNERIYWLRVKDGESEAELIGEECGLYYEGVVMGPYTVAVTLYSDGASGGYAVLELQTDNGFVQAATGTYLPVEGKENVFRFVLAAVSKDFADVTAYYNARPFRAYPEDSSFILEENQDIIVYTFVQEGKTYTLTCDGYGMATLQDNISTSHVRYALFDGYGNYRFLLYFSDSQGSALLRINKNAQGAGKIEAVSVGAVFGTQDVYTDRFGRLSEDVSFMLYYDGYMKIFGKDAKGDYTVLLSEGMCVAEGVNTGLYRFTGKGDAWEDLIFSVAYYGDECWLLPYNAEEKNLSNGNIQLDGSGLVSLADGYYRYVIGATSVALYPLDDFGGEPAYILPIENGRVVLPEVMGTYYLYENEDIGSYAILIDGRGNAVLKALSLNGEYIEITNHKLAVGSYTVSDRGEDVLNVVFTGEYAHFSGPICLFDLNTICIYVPGDYSNEREYSVEDGGSIYVDAFNRVIYTTPDGYNDPAWEAYLKETPNAVGDKTVVQLEILLWEGNVANVLMSGSYLANGTELTPITSVYGTYFAYRNGVVSEEETLLFDGLGKVSDGNRTGDVIAIGADDFRILWSDGSETRVLLSGLEIDDLYILVYTVYDTAHQIECYDPDTWATVVLDGYGNALAADALGILRIGTYEFLGAGNYRLAFTDGTSMTVLIDEDTYSVVAENA